MGRARPLIMNESFARMRNEELEIRNEGGGFAENIYRAMPEDRRIEVRCLMSPSLIPSLYPLLPAFKLQAM